VCVELSVDEAVMLEEARKRKGFQSKGKLIRFLIKELYKNEDFKKEFKRFIIDDNVQVDNEIKQKFTMIVDNEVHRMLRELANELSLSLTSLVRFIIRFVYHKSHS